MITIESLNISPKILIFETYFLVYILASITALGTIALVVQACSSTYSVTEEILTEIAKFDLDERARQLGIHSSLAELSSLFIYRPIQFTVADFYVISKPFFASVRMKFKNIEQLLTLLLVFSFSLEF